MLKGLCSKSKSIHLTRWPLSRIKKVKLPLHIVRALQQKQIDASDTMAHTKEMLYHLQQPSSVPHFVGQFNT
jgi:hypothetical protein